MNKVIALVPMRHHSERVPKKNYRLFAGKPLYHYIVESLLEVRAIDKVVIDTDSPFIIEDATANFSQVVVLERPENLRAGDIPMNDVLLNTIKQVGSEYYLQTHSTNPLLKSETITEGINTFFEHLQSYDSLFSVTRIHTRLWDKDMRPINHDPALLLRTQDLPPVFEENSCMYIFSKATLEKEGNRLGKRSYMFETDPLEAVDIDEEADFMIAEMLYKQREIVE